MDAVRSYQRWASGPEKLSRPSHGVMGVGTSRASLCDDASGLDIKHAELASQITTRGFDAAGIANAARSFIDGRPARYFEWKLPPHAVRVVALPLDDVNLSDAPSRHIGQLALTAANQIAATLPVGARYWIPPAGSLHLTIHHPGLSPTTGSFDSQQEPPSRHELQQELSAARRLAASIASRNISLDVDRLALTSSGALLLLLRAAPTAEPGATCVAALRAAAAATFPKAAKKQTSGLVHVSLLRITQLPPVAFGVNSSAARAAARVVDEWTARLRGLRASVHGLLYVREAQIMTLEGDWHRLRFGGPGGVGWQARRQARRMHERMSLQQALALGGTRPEYDHDRPSVYHSALRVNV